MVGQPGQDVAQLGGEHLAEHVVVVVDRGAGEMGLGRPVRPVPPRRTLELLVALGVFPPQGIQVLLRVLVQVLLEVQHDERPAGEDQLPAAALPADRPGKPLDTCLVRARTVDQPARVLAQGPEKHRHAFRRQGLGGLPEVVWQTAVDVQVVDRVAQLVQRRRHPLGGGLDVAQRAHVGGPVDAGAERVLVLPRALVEVAALQDVVDRQPDAPVEDAGDLDDVLLGLPPVELVQVHLVRGRRCLEEGVVVVPGHQFRRGDLEPRGQLAVHLRLGLGEGLPRQPLQLVEDGEQLPGVLLLEPDLHLPVVVEPQASGRLVAQNGQLHESWRHGAAHLLQGLPNPLSALRVALFGQHLEQIIVGEAFPVHLGAEGAERPFDLRGQLDELLQQFGGQLVGPVRQLGHLQGPGLDGRKLVGSADQALQTLVGGGVAVQRAHGQGRPSGGRKVLLLARVGRLPPGQVRPDFQLRKRRLVLSQERSGVGIHVVRLLGRGDLGGRGVAGTSFGRASVSCMVGDGGENRDRRKGQ